MAKTITWTELNGFHRAFINDKEAGFYSKAIEFEGFYWVVGSRNGFEFTEIEAIKTIEKLINHKEKLSKAIRL